MQRLQLTFSCQTQLRYELSDTRTARLWAGMLARMEPRFLLRTDVNHRHGFASPAEIRAAVVRLRKCADMLNFSFPAITRSNWQAVLNQVHIGFPEFFKTHFDPTKFQSAHEMNLLIHWLEYELMNLFADKKQYLFNLDFNHHPPAYDLRTAIPGDEFNNFSADLQFGNLHLHYIYVGRHYLEMFDARDWTSPAHHFRALHEFNATCGLVFSESADPSTLDRDMKDYYDQRGGKAFFGFSYDDPKLCKGFFRIGRLEGVDAFGTFAQRQALRDQLKRSRIAGWKLVNR